jgi:hypothetical protein
MVKTIWKRSLFSHIFVWVMVTYFCALARNEKERSDKVNCMREEQIYVSSNQLHRLCELNVAHSHQDSSYRLGIIACIFWI